MGERFQDGREKEVHSCQDVSRDTHSHGGGRHTAPDTRTGHQPRQDLGREAHMLRRGRHTQACRAGRETQTPALQHGEKDPQSWGKRQKYTPEWEGPRDSQTYTALEGREEHTHTLGRERVPVPHLGTQDHRATPKGGGTCVHTHAHPHASGWGEGRDTCIEEDAHMCTHARMQEGGPYACRVKTGQVKDSAPRAVRGDTRDQEMFTHYSSMPVVLAPSPRLRAGNDHSTTHLSSSPTGCAHRAGSVHGSQRLAPENT